MAHDVFVSYSAKDKPTADAVVATLEAKGIRCWIAPRDVLAGLHYGEAIIDAINASKAVVLVFSKNANESSQIRLEVERAVSKGISIIPLRIEDVVPGKSLEYFIGPVHWLDALTPPLERHLEQLASTIQVLLGRATEVTAPLPSTTPSPTAPPPIAPHPTGPATATAGTPTVPAAEPARPTLPRIPSLPQVSGGGLRRFIVPAGAVAVVLILVLAWRTVSAGRAAPQIQGIEFPKVIKADGVKVQGHISFRDTNGDLQTAEFDVVEASNFNSGKFDPSGVAGMKEGRFSFYSVSNVPQRVTQRVTLVDRAGHRSKPVTFTFEATPVPLVNLRTVRVSHKDEFRDQRKGIAFHVYLEIGGARGKDLTAVATIHQQNGTAVPAKSPEFSLRGTAGTSVRFVPRYEETVMKDMTLFVPFDQLPEIPGSTPYRARIQVWDGNRMIGNPYWYDFVLNRPK